MASVEEPCSIRRGSISEEFCELNQINRGSYGEVYRAKRTQDGLQVCLKLVDLELLSSQERLGCLSEVRLLRSLPPHPNVVACYDAFWDDSNANGEKHRLVLVLEYGDAGDLETFIQSEMEHKRLSAEVMLPLFTQIVSGLAFLHQHRIIHRDIKSKNIFRFKDGRVVIGDFGTSKSLLNEDVLLNTLVGSPLYMSPEQLDSHPYSFSSDVWSLGCLLYELFTGKTPFCATSYPAVVMKITKGAYDPLPSSTPAQIQDLVARMLQRAPSHRPTLEDILEEEALQSSIHYPTVRSGNVKEESGSEGQPLQVDTGSSRIDATAPDLGSDEVVEPCNCLPPPLQPPQLHTTTDDSKTLPPPPPVRTPDCKQTASRKSRPIFPNTRASIANIISIERISAHRERLANPTSTTFLSCVPVMESLNPSQLSVRQPLPSMKPRPKKMAPPIPQENLLIIGTKVARVQRSRSKSPCESSSQKSQ